MLYPFLPVISRGLGISLVAAGTLVTVRTAIGLLARWGGMAIDRFGVKRLVLVGMASSLYGKAKKPVTITYVTIGGAGMEPEEVYQEMIAEFERENPGIRVKVENWPYRQSYQKYITLVAAGSPPDCGCGFMSMLGELRARRAIVPVDAYMPETLREDFYENLLEPLRDEEGRLWAMPYWFSVRLAYYRKDWLGEAGLGSPISPEQMLEAAQKIHRPPGRYAFGISGGVTRHIVQTFAVWLWTWGGDFFAEDGRHVAFNSEAGVQALEAWVRMAKYAQPGYLSAEGVDVSLNFRLGIIGMWRDTTQSGVIIREENRPIEYDLVIAPVKH